MSVLRRVQETSGTPWQRPQHAALAAAVIARALDDVHAHDTPEWRRHEARAWLGTTGVRWLDLLGANEPQMAVIMALGKE